MKHRRGPQLRRICNFADLQRVAKRPRDGRLFFLIDYIARARMCRNAVAMHTAVCMPDRTEGAFKRARDRQPKVVLQRAGPASSLSFSYCFCERRRARGRIINAIFSSRSLSVRSWKIPVLWTWTMAIECTGQNGVSPLPLVPSLSRCQLRVAPLPRR